MQFPLLEWIIIIFHIDGPRLSEVFRSFNSSYVKKIPSASQYECQCHLAGRFTGIHLPRYHNIWHIPAEFISE